MTTVGGPVAVSGRSTARSRQHRPRRPPDAQVRAASCGRGRRVAPSSGHRSAMLPELAARAGAQHGVFTRQQALAAGYDAGEIRARLRVGEWVPVRRGVYADLPVWRSSASDPTARHRLLVAAALRAADGDVVASHHSACAVLGLDTLEPLDDHVRLTRTSGESHAGKTLSIRIAPLDDDEVVVVQDLPTTSAARTVLDVARLWPFRDAVVTADHALRLGLTDPPELLALAMRRPSWPRAGRVSQVVRFADGRAESVGESLARVVFAEEGLPPPTLQLEVFDGDEFVARSDFGWEDHLVIAEFDGRVKYTERDVLIREKRREDRLRALGWTVVRFGWEDLHRPRTLARRVRALLDQRRSA
jgi:hypothetical protein